MCLPQAITKAATKGTSLASHDLKRGEEALKKQQRQHEGARHPRMQLGKSDVTRGKVDVRAEVRNAVYGAHMPSLPGKLKLQWKGKDPAEKLYLKLKGQALTAKVCAYLCVMCV